ncbi:terminase small subunit [Clostridium saccharoperbutylacetonicum]|uniref:terminase small subunit n=1 Tax=Clostridium saccharoperbutylacetonicum TaxID=36745 RepID=UPI00098397E9|nr:terminase small subunit [Clostridium saccharoperbutylacetonicum]AQR95547.1 terminase small subunit [Clostridium saccharoperbutylacetonicum]NSB31407.1 phage terminase small subunit [Clostridium saccharoperbutylacetonicum]
MARAPNEKQIKAKELYDEGYKLIDISKELDTAESTIRVWKNRFKWDNEECNVSEKKCNVTVSKKKSVTSKKVPIADEVKEVMENDELNDKQRLFCVIYAKRMNATKAYQQAYKCSYETAMVNGSLLLRNTKIKDQVDKLTALELNKEALKRGVIQKYIDIAFSDITDYVQFGQDYYVVKDKEGNPQIDDEGNIITKPYNYVRLGESNQVDGTLINEISEGKDGVKIKLVDKMKALDFLTKHCNLLSDEEKIKLEVENKKLQNAKLEAEVAKAGKGLDNELKIVVDYGDADGNS